VSTRAIRFLENKGIPYDVAVYPHLEKGARFAAAAIGFPLEKTIKTLVVAVAPKSHVLALMPGDAQLSTRKLSRALSVKRTEMVDTTTAERLTGYTVGGISPFGTIRKIPVIMEQSLLAHDRVAVNGGKRGVMLMMTPRDILRAVDAQMGDIAETDG